MNATSRRLHPALLPMLRCPKWYRCSAPLCPLDREMARRTTVSGVKERRCSLPKAERMARAVREWMEVRPRGRGSWLFVSLGPKSRERLTSGGVGQMLKRRGKIAGTTGPVNPHAFRHAFARDYLLRGGDLASLSQLLGHASVEVTASYYAVFLVRELQEKHAKFSPIAGMEIE